MGKGKLLPRFYGDVGALMSDDRGPDAEGAVYGIEWLGFIVEFHFYSRRGWK